MANVLVPGVGKQLPYAGPHGNLSYNYGKLPSTNLAQNDTVDFVRLPKGAILLDVLVEHSAFGASVVLDLGLVAENSGSLGGADILIDGGNIAAAGILRRSEVGVYSGDDLVLDDDYLVRGLFAGADPAAGEMGVLVTYGYPGLS